MGSYIELNDTLQRTTEQGFPKELDLKKHLETPFTSEDFKNKLFEFRDKDGIRIFHTPPIRVFLVHNINGVWLYWGLIEVVEEILDMTNKKTAGKFKITKIFTPEEMRQAETILHPDQKKIPSYFASLKK